ncbi:MAG: site-2 protease family protein [Planctomycetaceae bacterium]|nr:site-2 protease family protein [Planctomycetaceae bacterium]
MTPTDGLLTFSFPMGRLLGVPLRLSFLMPVVVVALMWRLQDPALGAIAGVILLLSLLLHECTRLFVYRRYGQHPGSIVLWPLGGMYSAQTYCDFGGSMLCALVPPAANLAVAATSGWVLYQHQQLFDLLNPFAVLDLRGSHGLPDACLRTLFVVNWCLGILNLIPVRPLDGGQALQAFFNLRFAEQESSDLLLRIGLVASLFGILAGFVFDISSLVALSSFLLVLHIHDATRWVPPTDMPDMDESFLGYDFSEGYTSLNRSQQELTEEFQRGSSDSILERWRVRREEEKQRKEMDEQEADDAELDSILEKLHSHGRSALSPRELNILDRVSARLRQRKVGQ